MTLLKYAKKVTLRDAKEDVDKVCSEVQKTSTSDNAGGKLTRGFLLQHKNIYCFELRLRLWYPSEGTTNSKWPTLKKSRIVPCQYYHASVSTLNYVSPISANSDKRRWSCDELRDWIYNFRLVWQRTIRSESTQDKAGSLPPASRDYVTICYLFKKLKLCFCDNWIPKIMVQFCYLRPHSLILILFPVVCFNGLQGLKIDWNLCQQQDTVHEQVGKICTWLVRLDLWGRYHLMVIRLNLFLLLLLLFVLTAKINRNRLPVSTTSVR